MRAIALLLITTSVAYAGDPPIDPCACSPNKPGFHRASMLTGDWNGVRSDLFDKGIEIHGTYAGELFSAPELQGEGLVVAGLGALGVDVDLSHLEDKLGAFHIVGYGIHGSGVSQRLMDVYGVSNNVADNDVRLFETWIDQPIGEHFTLRAGLLSADQEFILANHSTVLIDATFGIVALLSTNIGGPVYPVAAPGVSARLETETLNVRAAIYDGDQPNHHGIPTGIGDDALAIGEVELWSTFKLGAWHHTERGNGFYTILDRQLERYVGAFTRISFQRHGAMDTYIDTGIRIGPGPFRPRDFLSIGLAFSRSEPGSQTVVEATYQYLVTGWLTIQPDAQVVVKRDGASVFAVRAVAAF